MKKILIILFMILIFSKPAYALEAPELNEEYLFNDTTEQIISGNLSLNPLKLFKSGINDFLKELKESSDIMLTFIMIAALSGIITVMQGAIKDSSIANAAFFSCFTLISAAAVKSFLIALEYGQAVIHTMSEFITKLSPMLIGLILSCGAITSATAFKPILTACVYIITLLVDKCLVPLICFGAVLSIVNNMSGKVQISNFTTIIQSLSRWILTGVLTIFTGITAIYGFSTPTLDALSARAVKFAVGSFVPVVGGLLSDAVETVVGGSMLVKNAVGTAGIIALCSICLVPILKIAVIVLILKLSAAAVEPLADKRITAMLQDVSSMITTILAMVITTAVMFIINVSIMISATNLIR